ncbi:SPOR domain-containing protein, partial [Thiorhodovibrio winogradskyi]
DGDGDGDGDGEGQSAAELAAVGAAPEDSPDASPNGSMESGTQETGAEQGTRETSAAGERDLDRDWILKQSGEHFTIQLTAARSLAAARQHVQGGGNLDVRFVPTRSKSQDFVVVLAGAYPTRADAERALEKLPAALREQGYWIRSVASVRQSLRQ